MSEYAYYIGIDPPNAIAILNQDGGKIYSSSFKKTQAATKAQTADERRLASIVERVDWIYKRGMAELATTTIGIEGPGFAGKFGFKGMWTIGHWAGVWRGLVAGVMNRQCEVVLPREWKQAMFPGQPIARSKENAMAYAARYGITNEDEAEALCIAEYLRRKSSVK